MLITFDYSNFVILASLAVLFAGSLILTLRPKRIYLIYLVIIMMFSGVLFGLSTIPGELVNTELSSTIYNKGGANLPFTLINIYLFGLSFVLAIFLRPPIHMTGAPKDPMFPYLLFFSLAYCIYTSIGLIAGVDPPNAFAVTGGLNFLNMMLFYVVVRRSLTNPADFQQLERVFVAVCGIMALYGVVRLLFGGDPANYYRNYEGKDVVITFVDPAQSAVFSICSVLLLLKYQGKLRNMSAFEAATIVLCGVDILLSYRRSCWLGLGLVISWFILVSDYRRKVVLVSLATLMFIAVVAISQNRYDASNGASITQDITDQSGNLTFSMGRLYELNRAVTGVISNSPIFGFGTWGVNDEFTVSYGNGPVSFVHDSFVHIFLKMGFFGLIPFVFMMAHYPIWWYGVRKKKWNNANLRYIGEAFFCGFIFWLPTIVFAPIFTIFRDAQIITLSWVIPVAARIIDTQLASKSYALRRRSIDFRGLPRVESLPATRNGDYSR